MVPVETPARRVNGGRDAGALLIGEIVVAHGGKLERLVGDTLLVASFNRVEEPVALPG